MVGNLRNKNAPPLADLVQEYIDSAYDVVKTVYDALDLITILAQAVEDGTIVDYLSEADIDTLAKLNAILTDAVLLSEADIDTLAKLNAYISDATIASQAYVDNAVVGLYDHKGSYNATTNSPDLDTAPAGIKKSDAYTVSVAGTFYAVALEAGDVLIANQDDPTASTHWTIVNRNIDSSAFATAAQGGLADTAIQPLDNISELTNNSGFTDDQTGAEIKVAYEGELDTNAFTDAEKTKLGLIEASATADQTASEIESLYNSQVGAASQVEMETGTEVAIRRMSPLRVAQAIAALAGGGGHSIEDEGTPLTQRTKLNFVGAGVAVTDDLGDDASVVTISGAGGGGGKETAWIPAASMKPTVSNGCASITSVETTAGRPDMIVLDFDTTADEHAQFQIPFPKRWALGTVTFQAYWTTTNAGTEGVAWGLQGVACSDADTIDVAYGTAVVVTDDAQTAAEDLYVTAESAAVTIAGTPADNDTCFFRVFRDVSDANDDMTQDARLIGIKLFYTTDAGTDA